MTRRRAPGPAGVLGSPALAIACALVVGVACGDAGGPPTPSSVSGSPSGPASSAPPPWLGIPKSKEEVEKETNKSSRAPYAGKTGTLRGVVKVTGDPPPDLEYAFGTECAAASATYSKLFNVSQDGGLADALVTVTGYDAYVPPTSAVVPVTISQCAFDQRVYSVTFGQRLEVSNVDAVGSYTPFLDGASYRSVMVALPKGAPIRVLPLQPAINYVLRDFQQRPFLQARVYTLKFATHDVTDRAGSYVIEGIPVGKVTVNVAPPGFVKPGEPKGEEIEIKEGENTLDLTIAFDAKTDRVELPTAGPFERKAAPSTSASAGPSAAPSAAPSAGPGASSQKHVSPKVQIH